MAYGLLQGHHVSLRGPVDATALVFAVFLLLAEGVVVYQLVKLRSHLPVRWRLVGAASGVGLLMVLILFLDPMHGMRYISPYVQVIFWGMLASTLVVASLAWMLSTAICQDRVARQKKHAQN